MNFKSVSTVSYVLLATAGGVGIYVPKGFLASFFTSPYAPHLFGKAVDVSTSDEFGVEFYSPVSGVVVKVVKVFTGLGPYSKYDYVIFLKVMNSYVKLMHIRPEVRPGDSISLGDVIGTYIRSNYFSYHHLPHAHIEVTKHLTLRPLKSLNIHPSDEFMKVIRSKYYDDSTELKLEVLKICKDFTLCRALNNPLATVGGVPMVPQGELGVGVGYLGLIHLSQKPPKHGEVFFLGKRVGYVVRIGEWYSILSREKVSSFSDWFLRTTSIGNISRNDGWYGSKVYVNGREVEGVEFLVGGDCNVKIVGSTGLKTGDKVVLSLS